MNERIRNLLIRAQDLARTEVENDPSIKPPYHIPATQVHKGLGLSYEKFAELLIEECANVVDKYVVDGDIDIAKIIKRHFGVSE